MADYPGILQLERALVAERPRGRIDVHVRHPTARFRCRQHLGSEVIAVDVGAHPPLDVQPSPIGGVMADHDVVLVDDKHVPLAVDAGRAVEVGQRGAQPVGLIPGDGLVHHELGVGRRIGLRRCPQPIARLGFGAVATTRLQ